MKATDERILDLKVSFGEIDDDIQFMSTDDDLLFKMSDGGYVIGGFIVYLDVHHSYYKVNTINELLTLNPKFKVEFQNFDQSCFVKKSDLQEIEDIVDFKLIEDVFNPDKDDTDMDVINSLIDAHSLTDREALELGLKQALESEKYEQAKKINDVIKGLKD